MTLKLQAPAYGCTDLKWKDVAARLRAKLNHTLDGCWMFEGAGAIYGNVTVNKQQVSAHVLAHVLWIGPVPEGLEVLHSCDRPKCCNPAHLSAGTHADNMAESVARGRRPMGERNGNAKLTKDIVQAIRSTQGTDSDVAKKFGVSRPQVNKIRSGEAWPHVD